MARELLLGVDIGTYSSKGVVCAPDGRVLAAAAVEHGLSLPRPGWAEQDADAVWWGDLVEVSRRLLAAGSIRRRSRRRRVSAIGSCLLPVDGAGTPLRPGILYGIDTRATEEIAWLNDTFGDEELRALGGMGLTSQAMGPKILWLRRHEPEVYARAARMATSSSYLVFKLTGEWVMDRHSASYYNPLDRHKHHGMGRHVSRTRSWNSTVCRRCCGRTKSRAKSALPPLTPRASAPGRPLPWARSTPRPRPSASASSNRAT